MCKHFVYKFGVYVLNLGSVAYVLLKAILVK